MAMTAPRGPTYVNLDAALQESELDTLPPLPDPSRFRAPEPPRPAPELVARAAGLLSGAAAPVILVGRGNRTIESWRARVALAEKLQARAITDLKQGAAFPTRHPLHVGPPGSFLSDAAARTVREADVVLALDWIDLAGTLRQAYGDAPVTARIVSASCDVHVHRGFSMDYFGLPPVDVNLLAEGDVVVPLLLEACRAREGACAGGTWSSRHGGHEVLSLRAVADALNEATDGVDVASLASRSGGRVSAATRAPARLPWRHGGAGGAGPASQVGAALA
jgi:hypothetical protein